jgi:hypothetical protein
MGKTFKAIPKLPGYYVSNDGHVISIRRNKTTNEPYLRKTTLNEDGYRTLRLPSYRVIKTGPRRPKPDDRSKLHPNNIEEIREARRKGLLLRDISDVFGVGLNTISRISRGVTWKHA